MTIKTRLAALEQRHAATAKRAAVKLISTPETRARAATELDAWRRKMVGDGLPAIAWGPNGPVQEDTEALLTRLHENTLQRMANIEGMAASRAELEAARR